MKIYNFNRMIASTVAAAFLLTSLIPQNAFSSQETSANPKILNSIRNAVPKSAGYITDHNIVAGDKVLIYIQDLHCNPGVQKNISSIISELDKNIGIDKVILEGVPYGKVESNVLTALPEQVKYSVVEKLLSRGLLTGVELYSVDTDKNNIYGVENWDKYIENLTRAADLIQISENSVINIKPFEKEVYRKTKKTLDILGELASFKRDDKWYEKLSKAELRYSEPIYKYKNLSNYVNLRDLSGKIDLTKVRKELESYTNELKNTLSYRDFNNIASKMDNQIEYYQAVYAAAENGDFISFIEEYPNLYLFLAYSIRSSAINPILVFYDEETYVNKILNSETNDNAKFDDLLLYRMTSLLGSYLSLSMTDNEFEYFSGNIGLYKSLISKKYPLYRNLIFSYLDNAEYYKYYRANIDRNAIFFENLSKSISDGSKVNVFVSGGFHTSLIEDFKKQGISYVLVTPVVLEDFNSIEVYNRLIEINSSVPKVLRNALNPIPFMLAVFPQLPEKSRQAYLGELVNSIAGSARGFQSPSELKAIIEEWGKNIQGIGESDISVSYDNDIFKINILKQVLEFKIKNGRIDFKQSELFIPKTARYKSVRAALSHAKDRFSPFSPSTADYAEHFAVRAVNKAVYMGMKISGDFYSRISRRKEDDWAFRFMNIFHTLNMKKTAKSILAAIAWAHTKSSAASAPARTAVLQIDGRTINVVIENGINISDNELLEIIDNARNLPRDRAPIENIPETIFIGLVDKSSHLFENYTGIGFIGINRALFEIGTPLESERASMTQIQMDRADAHARKLQQIFLKIGLSHEIAHEFLGKVDGREMKIFEDTRLMQDIAYIINEIKKLYPIEEIVDIDADHGEHLYNEKIKNEYILPFIEGILGSSVFMKKLKGYKLTLDELIELVHEKNLSDSDITHLEETYLTTITDKSDERKENEEKFFKSIVLKERKKINIMQSDFIKNQLNYDNMFKVNITSIDLKNKLEEILFSTDEFSNEEIARMTEAFYSSIAGGIDILYETLPDHLFERYFNNRTMVKEHGLAHSLDILSYMLDILAKDKDRLKDLSDKNIKLMVYSAMFHDVSTIISRGNHERNSAIMTIEMLRTYKDKYLNDEDIEELAKICEGHKKVVDDSKLRPEHSNYFACILHDADAFSAVFQLDRIFSVWAKRDNALFFDKSLSIKQRIKLLKENNFLDGDTVNDLIRQGYFRRKPYLYITEGAKTIIISNQSKRQLIDYFKSKSKEIETIHGGRYKSDINEILSVVNEVIDELNPSMLQPETSMENRVSYFTVKNRFFLLWQLIKGFFGSKNIRFPKNVFMSDVHGGYDRLVDLFIHFLNIKDPIAAQRQPIDENASESEKQMREEAILSEKRQKIVTALKEIKALKENKSTRARALSDLLNAIYVGGDSVDRGDGQLKTIDLMADIANAGLLRYVIGNHDLWSFMNIMGIHLPYYKNYKGINADYEDKYGNVKNLLVKMIETDEKANVSGMGELYTPPNGATDKLIWAKKLAEYMDYAKARQKEKWDEKYKKMCSVFEKAFGYELNDKGKDVLNNPEGIFKNDDLRKWWGLILGRNVGVMVSTGLRAVDQMSINWWTDKKKELQGLRAEYGKTDAEKEAFDEMEKLIDEIVQEQTDKMDKEVAAGNWMWRVIDAIMYRNYESVEWWALDWAYHNSWGGGKDGLIAQRNQEIEEQFRADNNIGPADVLNEEQKKSLDSMKRTSADYLSDSRIQSIGRFFQNNFFLYRIDEYGTYMMHSLLPVDQDGDIAIGKVVNGKIEKYDEKGKRIKGFYYKGKHYYKRSFFKGLDKIVNDIRNFDFQTGDPSEIIEALVIINSWYADLTTEIKPTDIKKVHQRIGFGNILSKMGSGIMRLTVGHNPVSKSKSQGLHPVEFAGMDDARIILCIDDEFSKRYAPPRGKGTVHIYKGDIGIISAGFESGEPNAVIVSNIVVSRNQFLRSVLHDISKPLAKLLEYLYYFYDNIIYNLMDFIKSKLYLQRDIWDIGNTLVVNVIREENGEKNRQHYNTNILTNRDVNIVGIELKETDITRESDINAENSELAESEKRLHKVDALKVLTSDGDIIEIPVSYMYKKVRKNQKFTNYIGVYIGLEAKKIIKARGKQLDDDLKNRILYAATATFIEDSKRKGNLFEKTIRPVNSKRKILMRTTSIMDFDKSLTDRQKRAMEGVLVARDGENAVADEAYIDSKFLRALTTGFGNLALSNYYLIPPLKIYSAIEDAVKEQINDTKPVASMLSAA